MELLAGQMVCSEAFVPVRSHMENAVIPFRLANDNWE